MTAGPIPKGGTPMMEPAVVRWFDPGRGYGFLDVSGHAEPVFVHFSVIAGTGWRQLTQGQRVRCEVALTARGPRAARVEADAPSN